MIRWLADENLHSALVAWLRARGDDCRYVAEESRSVTDDAVLDLADAEGRVAITLDKDFGELVFASGRRPRGVVLFRIGPVDGVAIVDRFAIVWPQIEGVIEGNFVVIGKDSIRVRPIYGPA